MAASITIKELHATTGEHVRRAGAALVPVFVTDRGEPVAVLANPALLKQRRRQRTLLPEFAELMGQAPTDDVSDDFDAVRADR
jgi:antitoxin (DNA-binding transcriptional repressor) of toxin-antitoxin stability system